MAVIKKYEEARNPDKNGIQYNQKITFDGVDSDEIILPAVGSHTFNFVTAGSGTIQVSMSSASEIENGSANWVNNDYDDGPAFASPGKMGAFSGVSGIRVVTVTGACTLEVITKVN